MNQRGGYMSTFLKRFLNHKKYIMIAIAIVLGSGFLYGFYQYFHTYEQIKSWFQNFFYLPIENYQNKYQFYMIQNGLYIFICTYLSSSYIGHLGSLFLIFLKGIQLSFSCLYVFTHVDISFIVIFVMIIEILLEIALCIIMNYMYIYTSIYVTLVTFCIEQTFNIKSMLNYKLNCLIISLLLFLIGLAFRLYIVPMF